ncbi:hypothetical protein FQN54_004825 [Arachnomyces sp. PD_36]|nr:hypothetical protein FQN54_004825 [Arachnomyces sp. PD_36]
MKASVYIIGLLASAAAAIPTPTLVKRAEPSSYPGPGYACQNEMLYLNFDMSNEDDVRKVKKIHDAYCDDLGRLIVMGHGATKNDETIFHRFFNEGDEEVVASVYELLSDLTPTLIVDNEDFGRKCEVQGDILLGYTGWTRDGDGLEKTHFCNSAFDKPSLESISCETLEAYPSNAMNSFALTMLHEFTHFEAVGHNSQVGSWVDDFTNLDGKGTYGAARAHALKDERPDSVTSSAENYAWLATNMFFAIKCNKPFDDPPPYPGQPGSNPDQDDDNEDDDGEDNEDDDDDGGEEDSDSCSAEVD